MSAPTYQIKLCPFEGPWHLGGKPYGLIAQIIPDAEPLMGVLFCADNVWSQLDEAGRVLPLDQALVSETVNEASSGQSNAAIQRCSDFIDSLGREEVMIDFSKFRFPAFPPRAPDRKIKLEPTSSCFYIPPPKPPKPTWA